MGYKPTVDQLKTALKRLGEIQKRLGKEEYPHDPGLLNVALKYLQDILEGKFEAIGSQSLPGQEDWHARLRELENTARKEREAAIGKPVEQKPGQQDWSARLQDVKNTARMEREAVIGKPVEQKPAKPTDVEHLSFAELLAACRQKHKNPDFTEARWPLEPIAPDEDDWEETEYFFTDDDANIEEKLHRLTALEKQGEVRICRPRRAMKYVATHLDLQEDHPLVVPVPASFPAPFFAQDSTDVVFLPVFGWFCGDCVEGRGLDLCPVKGKCNSKCGWLILRRKQEQEPAKPAEPVADKPGWHEVVYDQSLGLMKLIELAVGPDNIDNIDREITAERFKLRGTSVRKIWCRVEVCLRGETIGEAAVRLMTTGHTLGYTGDLTGYLRDHHEEVMAKWPGGVLAISEDSQWMDSGSRIFMPRCSVHGTCRDFRLSDSRDRVNSRYGVLVVCEEDKK